MSTAFLFIVLVAVCLGWLVDRTNLAGRIEQENRPISRYSEKLRYWSPAAYFNVDNTSKFEAALGHRLTFGGKTVTSSQGVVRATLRQPDIPTLDATISLLDDEDAVTRLTATKLLALYLEASSGSKNLDPESVAVRIRFHALGLRRVLELLNSSDSEMRSAAALVLGNSFYDWETIRYMSDAFDKETDNGVKLHLAWAYFAIGHNYPGAEWYAKQKANGVALPADESQDETDKK
jgi:hypothetical protein